MNPKEALTLLMQELQQAIDLSCKVTGLGYQDVRMKRLNEAHGVLATAIQRLKAHTDGEPKVEAEEGAK